MGSLEETERMSAAVAKAPRVKLKDIEDAIAQRIDVDGGTLVAMQFHRAEPGGTLMPAIHPSLDRFCMCLLVMQNGFVVVGKAAPASPENFDRELGRTYAYEDAMRQLWPLMGYALRDKLSEAGGYDRTGKSNVQEATAMSNRPGDA